MCLDEHGGYVYIGFRIRRYYQFLYMHLPFDYSTNPDARPSAYYR